MLVSAARPEKMTRLEVLVVRLVRTLIMINWSIRGSSRSCVLFGLFLLGSLLDGVAFYLDEDLLLQVNIKFVFPISHPGRHPNYE
jgi:hypothetical protein